MNNTWKRILTLVLALLLAVPAFALSDGEDEGLILPDSAMGVEELKSLEDVEDVDDLGLDVEGLDDLGLSLDLDGDEGLEIPDALALDDAEALALGQENGALADNDLEYVNVPYVDAKGNKMEPVKCAVVKAGNQNRILGNGWYAVTKTVLFTAGMIVWGDANVILCDGATLASDDGIWVQEKASLTIWAQSTGKKMGKIKSWGKTGNASREEVRKAGIGGIDNEVAGAIIINGGDIFATSASKGAAGIGGGFGEKSGYTRIEINGGKVNASAADIKEGSRGSGIGSGYCNETIGNITITGGNIRAVGRNEGAGIGSQIKKDLKGKIKITGGHVYAESFKGAGISGDSVTISGDIDEGDYVECIGGDGGAGITGNTVTIESGDVYAGGEQGGAGIGGNNGKDGGTIVIKGGTVETAGNEGGAGIGGGNCGDSGTITITGGTVKVNAWSNDAFQAGAGIGSGDGGDCYDVTITGGTVTAKGAENGGAGIGGARRGDLMGDVTITDGNVSAYGNGGGAGIGGGYRGNAGKGDVDISGGKVVAMGSQRGAGIGGGREGADGAGGEGSNVSITGTADVVAFSGGRKDGDRCSAIGHGHDDREYGTITFGDNMMVQANWNEKDGEADEPFPRDNRRDACFYRWYAHIQPCVHRNATYADITEKTHTLKVCKYCKQSGKKEKHNFDPKTHKCRGCGYSQKIEITFDANGGKGSMDKQELTRGEATKLNANAFTWKGHTFKEWNTRADGSGKSFKDQATVTLNKDDILYAQWYTNVTLKGMSKRETWTGEPITVEGFNALLPDGTPVKEASFPGVSASRTETEPGTYPVKVMGAKLNETTDKNKDYLVTKIEDGELRIEGEICTVTFDDNGGDGRMKPQRLLAGKTVRLNANTFASKYLTFKEWNTERDGSGQSYADKAKITLTKDITLYAQWYTNVTLVSDSLTVEWDGNAHSIDTFKVKIGKNVIEADFPEVLVRCRERNAGVYPAEFRQATPYVTTDSSGQFMVTKLVEGKLTIEKKTPKIEPPTRREGLVYNGRYQRLIELGSSDSGQLHYSLDKEEWGVKAPQAKDAGTHTVYYKTFGDDNHKDSETGELKVTIAPKPLSVRAHRLMKYAGDPDPKLTYDWDNLEYGDALTGALTRDKGEMPGTYPIRLGTLSAGSNYKIEYVGEVLVILPNPKAEPRIQPTVKPTEKPTATPTAKPTTKPTVKPTVKPTTTPPDTPIVKPTVRPTAKPIGK